VSEWPALDVDILVMAARSRKFCRRRGNIRPFLPLLSLLVLVTGGRSGGALFPSQLPHTEEEGTSSQFVLDAFPFAIRFRFPFPFLVYFISSPPTLRHLCSPTEGFTPNTYPTLPSLDLHLRCLCGKGMVSHSLKWQAIIGSSANYRDGLGPPQERTARSRAGNAVWTTTCSPPGLSQGSQRQTALLDSRASCNALRPGPREPGLFSVSRASSASPMVVAETARPHPRLRPRYQMETSRRNTRLATWTGRTGRRAKEVRFPITTWTLGITRHCCSR
jgi:hypothetical protein